MTRIGCVALSLIVSACATPNSFDPAGLDDHVVASESMKRAFALSEAGQLDPGQAMRIFKVSYQGKPAYLVMAPCCDQLNHLYDAGGKRLCAPFGGYAGHGDGKCSEAFEFAGVTTRTRETSE